MDQQTAKRMDGWTDPLMENQMDASKNQSSTIQQWNKRPAYKQLMIKRRKRRKRRMNREDYTLFF